MDDARLLFQLIGLMLMAPTSLLAYTDWKHRRRAVASHTYNTFTTEPARSTPPWPPPPTIRDTHVPPTTPPPPQAGKTNGLPLPLIRRLLSAFVDWYLLIAAATLVGAALSSGASLDSDQWTGFDSIGLAIAFGAMTQITASTGRSVGKLIFGGRLTTADGQRLSFIRVAIRSIAAVVLGALLLINYLAALGDPYRRALHDRICRTWVVKTR